ncbi:MAG: T9SS C-terminal target domain-containing protein [Chitinophagia bacterium]|nr:T9SS C-terminal target domain-containing protein [Chitinophagia bacterium]
MWSSSDPGVAMIDSSTGTITGMSAGTATISFTRYNSCGLSNSATRTITVIAAKDANGNDLPESVQTYVSIYPNPTSDVLNISLPEGSENATIILTDITGKVVATQQATSLSQTLNLSGLAKGNYMLTIATATRKWVEKVMVVE